MELAFRTLAINGIRRFALADPTNDAASNVEVAKGWASAPAANRETACPRTRSARSTTTRTMPSQRARWPPARTSTRSTETGAACSCRKRAQNFFIRRYWPRSATSRSSCTTTARSASLKPACLEAADLGVAAVQCASGGAADGTSNPPITRMIANLKAMGHTVDIDEDAAREVAEYFTALAEAEGLPTGKPMHFDAAYLRHQLPGGMVGTTRRHLADHGVPELEAG